jgi:hypothetical protein
MARPWIDAVITAVTEVFKARQDKRAQDKANRAAKLDAMTQAGLLQKEQQLQQAQAKGGFQTSAALGGSGSILSGSNLLPIALIGGVVVIGVMVMRR